MAKRDKNQATGFGSGSKVKYSKFGEFVLDIIERESAAVEDLKVAGTWEHGPMNNVMMKNMRQLPMKACKMLMLPSNLWFYK